MDDPRLAGMSSPASHFTEGRPAAVGLDERTLAVPQAGTRGARAAFFILMFVSVTPRAWIVWPSTGGGVMIPRLISCFSDSDGKAYRERRKAEEEAGELARGKRRSG